MGIHNHSFDTSEIEKFRLNLLKWYDVHKRDLQWRHLAKHSDPNVRAYSVLVSEIMLQQTQVSTVKSYYAKWIDKWPDVSSLSGATLEEVNTLWSGLGYYSRGRRLHESACKVVNELDGVVPSTSELLQKTLPGVGRYTASAIASIAFSERVGVVDGNVIRVMSRLRSIGADINRKNVMDLIWQLANTSVDPERPGDFNQAMMELGATVCTAKSPDCENCPVSDSCRAYQRSRNENDIEDVSDCLYCLPAEQPWSTQNGVTNFPRKSKKAVAKLARNIVFIVDRPRGPDKEYLLWQRPATGLLANLWEFPSLPSDYDGNSPAELELAEQKCRAFLNARQTRLTYVSDVFHQFSHISQTYAVHHCPAAECVDEDVVIPDNYQAFKWSNVSEIATSAISTAMKKVLRGFNENSRSGAVALKRKGKGDHHARDAGKNKKQMTLRSYFTT